MFCRLRRTYKREEMRKSYKNKNARHQDGSREPTHQHRLNTNNCTPIDPYHPPPACWFLIKQPPKFNRSEVREKSL